MCEVRLNAPVTHRPGGTVSSKRSCRARRAAASQPGTAARNASVLSVSPSPIAPKSATEQRVRAILT